MNILKYIPRKFHPQWYMCHNHETGKELFFDTQEECFDHMICHDVGPESPKFTVHEVDIEFMNVNDFSDATTCTNIGGLMVGNFKPILGDLVCLALLAVLIGMPSYGVYSNGGLHETLHHMEANRHEVVRGGPR